MTNRIIWALALCICFIQPLFSQYGTLDLSFSGDGIFTADPSVAYDICTEITTQEDGKLVTVGMVPTGSSENYTDALVFRVNPNGTLDSTFNQDGILIMDVSNGQDDLYTVRMQPDGKILVAGTSKIGLTYRLWLMRLLPNGDKDPTFGNLGMVYFSEDYYHSTAYDIELLPDGKILVAGSHGWGVDYYKAIVLKYTPEGLLDESFGNNGTVIIHLGQYTKANDLEVLSDGGIVVAVGSAPGISSDITPALIKLNGDGSFNNDFGVAGIVLVSSEIVIYHGFIAIALYDMSIILSTCNGEEFTLLRYNALNGQLDASFGTDGKVVVEMEEDIKQTGLVVQPDGKILASGYLKESFNSTLFVSRFTNEGDFDSSFGVNGIVRTSVFDEMDDSSSGICLQANGKIVLSAMARDAATNYVCILRYESGLVLPSTEVAEVGFVASVAPNPAFSEITLQYYLKKTQAVKVYIMDLTGNCIKICTSSEIRNAGLILEHLPIYELSKGSYFIIINTELEGTTVLKLIKG